jgi:hypothetical protein
MKTRVPILTLWRSTIFFVLGAVALIFALQYMCVHFAQEQSTTAPQPVNYARCPIRTQPAELRPGNRAGRKAGGQLRPKGQGRRAY